MSSPYDAPRAAMVVGLQRRSSGQVPSMRARPSFFRFAARRDRTLQPSACRRIAGPMTRPRIRVGIASTWRSAMKNDEDTDTSRRAVVGALSTGLVAATLGGPALAQQRATSSGAPGASTRPRQTEAYPTPPFPPQQHPWPGLAGKMDPLPDHGETSYQGSGRLAGRKALVTGGDSGIGRAAVIAFAREGADVAFNYLPAEEPDARQVVQLIEAEGRKAVPLPGDIRDEAFCTRLVSDAVRDLGGLDILVNNAARQISHDSIVDITTEQFDATFKTNVYAMFWIIRAAMPHLEAGATIINTASVNAYDASETIIDYAAPKGAIMIFTKGLAKQLARGRVSASTRLLPGRFGRRC